MYDPGSGFADPPPPPMVSPPAPQSQDPSPAAAGVRAARAPPLREYVPHFSHVAAAAGAGPRAQPHHPTVHGGAGGGPATPHHSRGGSWNLPTIDDDDDDDDDDAADVAAAAAVAGTTTPHHTTGGVGRRRGAVQDSTTPHHTTGAGGGEQCKTAGLRGCQPLGGGGGGGRPNLHHVWSHPRRPAAWSRMPPPPFPVEWGVAYLFPRWGGCGGLGFWKFRV